MISEKILYFFEKTNYPFIAACIIFFLSTLVVAAFVGRGLPPDEAWHIGIIQYYAIHSLSPIITTQNEMFFVGDLTRIGSYLYHYIFSFYYRFLEALGVHGSIFLLRLPNVFIALGSLLVLKRIASFIGLNRLAINLGAIFVVSMPMFIFLSGSVNYDNLAILFALLIILYTLKVRNNPTQIKTYLLLVILWSAGALTKFALLPIVAASALISGYYLIRHRTEFIASLQNIKMGKSFLIVALLALVLSGLAVERYGYNYLTYQRFQPRCDEIHEFEQCMEYGIFARSHEFNQNPPTTDERVSIPVYVATWSKIMFERTYGVLGHAPYEGNVFTYYSALLIFGFLAVATIRKVDKKDLKNYAIPLFIFAAYLATLMYRNHGSYQNRNIITLAVQGRYLFVVLFPVLLIGMNYLVELSDNKYFKVVLIIGVTLLSVLNGLPSLLAGLDNYWKDSFPELLRI